MKILVVICCLIPILSSGQHDTLELKSLIPQTDEYYAHKEFWQRMHDRDQELRKSPDIETIDEENLISLIYYFNNFGYPDIDRLGENAKIVTGVWGHNRYSKIDRYTFPIILAGFNAGVITEPAYREFYLRQMYQLRFDGNDYTTLPVENIHHLLNLRERNQISIDTVLSLLAEFKQIRNDTNHILGRWIASIASDTIYFEGKSLIKKGERHEVILYETVNGKYYLMQEAIANGVEPVELVPLNLQKTQFAFSGKESSKYYLITENKDLVYTDNTGKIFKSYIACL